MAHSQRDMQIGWSLWEAEDMFSKQAGVQFRWQAEDLVNKQEGADSNEVSKKASGLSRW